MRADDRTGPNGAAGVGLGVPRAHLFVGRNADLRLLTEVFEQRVDSLGAVLIRGAAGVGKTTLLDRWLPTLPTGAFVLRGGADAFDRGFPYSALDHSLTEALRPNPTHGRSAGLLPERRSRLAQLRELIHGLGDTTGLFEAQAATRGLLDALGDLTDHTPVMVLEDAHDADPDTLSVCAMLTRHVSARLLIVVTLRPGYANTALLEAYFSRLAERGVAEILDLAPLGDDDAKRLLSHQLGYDPDPKLVRRLVDHAGGNPFFLRELADELRADIAGNGGPPDAQTWTPRPKAVMVRRLSAPDSVETRVAELLSVSGEADQDRVAMLPDLTDLPPGVIADALDSLVEREILVCPDTRYRFRHDLVREAYLASLGGRRRQLLQTQLAEKILRRREQGVPVAVFELARLLAATRTAPDPETMSVLAEAADLAARSGAFLVAAEWQAQARRFAGDPTAAQRLAAAEMELLNLAGQNSRAWRVAEEIIETTSDDELCSILVSSALAIALSAGHAGAVEGLFHRLPETDVRPMDLAIRAAALLMQWDPAGVAVYERALTEPRTTHDHYATNLVLYSCARLLCRVDDMRDLTPALKAAIDANPDPATQFIQLAACGSMSLFGPMGTHTFAARDPRLSREALAAAGWPISSASGVAEEFYLEWNFLRGYWDDVLDLLPGLDTLDERGQEIAVQTGRVICAGVLLSRGREQEGRRLLDQIDDDATAIMAGYLASVRCRLRAADGDLAGAIETLERFHRRAAATGIWYQDVAVVEALCGLLVEAGEPDRARELAAESLATERRLGLPIALANALINYGILHDDIDALRESEQMFADQEMPFPHAQAMLALAERGVDPHGNLRRAYRIFTDLKTTQWRQRAVALMRANGVPLPRRRGVPDGLTPIENEIARLVVDRLTNNQIADRLGYSPKTVEMHLTRIYDRTGVGNRIGLVEAVATGRLAVD
ncbi:hypothetical protein GCM10009624_09000 [Gordonia sinesedis]